MHTDSGLKMFLGLLLFLTELFFWFSVGLLTHRLLRDVLPKAAVWFSVVAGLVVIGLWAFFVSPKATFRLPLVWRLIAVVTAMIIVGVYLLVLGETVIGSVLLASFLIFIPGQILIYGE